MNTDTRQIPDHVLQVAIDELHQLDGLGDNGDTENFIERLQRLLEWKCTDAERTAVESLMQSQGLTALQVLRQALRHYQMAVQSKPTPPTADGKTPGQVAYDHFDDLCPWAECQHKQTWEAAASAVLTAFGQASLEAGIKRMEEVPANELHRIWQLTAGSGFQDFNAVRACLIAAAREGQPAVDPYAELKAAHAAGKVIQWQDAFGKSWTDYDQRYHAEPGRYAVITWRIKPEPTTFEAHGQTWTKHNKGDPMPCDGARNVILLYPDGRQSGACPGSFWTWGVGYAEQGWRYADKPEPNPVKPWTLPPPPPGRQWHCTDWTEDMLPDGWRPLLRHEPRLRDDEYFSSIGDWREVSGPPTHENLPNSNWIHHRTRRPLPQPPVLVPLDASDIRATDEFRELSGGKSQTLDWWDEDVVKLAYNGTREYKNLAKHYLRRQHGSEEWKPCTKEKK